MRTRKYWSVLLTVGLVASLAGTARAQEWDPNRYLELLEDGNRMYDEAMDLGSGHENYEEILYDALALKQEALEMLRRAVLAREIPDYLMEDARLDLFNLNENVMFLLMELDQCAAAELLLDRSAMDTAILPEGGLDHLMRLRGDLDECHRRVAAEQSAAWDYDGYLEMIYDAEDWRDQAADTEDPAARRAALFESTNAYGRALDYLREGLLMGQVPELTGLSVFDLYDLYDILIGNFLQMNLCPSAERRLEQAIADSNVFREGDPERYEERRPEIEQCRVRAEQEGQQGPPGMYAFTPVIPRDEPPPLPDRMEYGITPYILLGVCGASALTALGLDIATGEDRDELETLRDQCNAGSCDYARSLELSDNINDRKAIIGVLTGASVVTGVVGIVMLVLDLTAEPPPPESEPSDVEAVFGFDELGVRINF